MSKPKDHYNRAVIVDCCRDRTLTYRRKGQPSFNDRALPVFTVNNKKEAEELIATVSRVQYDEHPDIPGKTWYKVTLDGELDFKAHLDLEDLSAVTEKLAARYGVIRSMRSKRKAKSIKPKPTKITWAEAHRKAPKQPPTSCQYFDAAITHMDYMNLRNFNERKRLAKAAIEKARRVNDSLRHLAWYWRNIAERATRVRKKPE